MLEKKLICDEQKKTQFPPLICKWIFETTKVQINVTQNLWSTPITTSTSPLQSARTSLPHPLEFQSGSFPEFNSHNQIQNKEEQTSIHQNRISGYLLHSGLWTEPWQCYVDFWSQQPAERHEVQWVQIYKCNSFRQSITFDLIFLNPARCKIVWTVLPAFIPVLVGPGHKYT